MVNYLSSYNFTERKLKNVSIIRFLKFYNYLRKIKLQKGEKWNKKRTR